MIDFDVIAAFVDGERVNARALADALGSAEGREYLIDVVALREVALVPAEPGSGAVARPRGPARIARWIGVAAALLVALAAGYQTGLSRSPARATAAAAPAVRTDAAPPAPTVVIKLEPGAAWRDVEKGGRP
ncbi:MAG: hypothetical protein A3H96_06365 [Acidobacteria bacterium RIFCSPLOWO2_02_FULL_67_36]|nr:MAG: hypothetical protein A3H96_06365 [Acidobacteria bacterium RIFCSPLOWO2_02_FULL_67_36]OFW25907.1 MAG: hypothetical protein A3G21_15205 [Acidobacteria bacterium RIFCSPLOWO2_12_FULL_66_21]